MRSRLTRLLAPIFIAIAAAVTLAAPAQAVEAGPSAEALQTGCQEKPPSAGTFCYYLDNNWITFIGQRTLGIADLPSGISSLRNRTDQWWCVYTGTNYTGDVRAVHGWWEEKKPGSVNNVAYVGAWPGSWNDNIRSARPLAVC